MTYRLAVETATELFLQLAAIARTAHCKECNETEADAMAALARVEAFGVNARPIKLMIAQDRARRAFEREGLAA